MHTTCLSDTPSMLYPLGVGPFHWKYAQQTGGLPLFWAASGLEFRFTGEELHLVLEADFDRLEPWIAVSVDGAPLLRMPLNRGENEVCVLRGTADGVPRHVRLLKETQPMTEDPAHRLLVRELRWSGGEFLPMPAAAVRLEFIGDSLTSGEGLAGARKENAWVPAFFRASRTWACQTADLLNADFRLVSQSGWGLRSGWDNDPRHALPDWYGRVRAMGVPEPPDPALWQPDAVVVNLGTNDANAMEISAWHGPDGQRFKQEDSPQGRRLVEDSAVAFLKQLRRYYPCAKLVWAYGMAGDPLRAPLEDAVARFREEAGDEAAYYLPLPAAGPEAMGSRQHPGEPSHREAAELTAAFLKEIL